MRLDFSKMALPLAALAACLFGLDARGQAPGQAPAHGVYYSNAGVAAASACASCDAGCGDSACGCGDQCDGSCGGSCAGGCDGSCGAGGGLGLGAALAGRGGQLFFGAELLHVRADFSEATSHLERDLTNFVDTFHQYDFNYNDSYRFYGGYRSCDCCSEVVFSFARYRSDANNFGGPASSTNQFIAPLEVIAVVTGDTIQTSASVDARNYNLDFARTIPLGSELGDCCGCNWCPAWDIKWFAGLRYDDITWTRDAASFDASGAARRTGRTQMDFNGGGLRVGTQGRRYIGRSGKFSVFAKGTISLLLGDVNYVSTQTDVATPGIVPTQRASFTRIIPVTDLEAGATIHVRDNITVSGGYLLSAWHDLGMGDQYDFGLQLEYDDANILGFDGYFVRAEVAY